MAFTHGLYELVMIPKEGGDKIAIKGKFLTILKKQVDGSWKIAIDCFNNDAPSI
jgi:ketosteroid isomerase-like protein